MRPELSHAVRSPWLLRLIGFLVLTVSAVSVLEGQVYEIQGGNSSLYQAGGGKISITAPNYDLTIGAGTYSGHLMAGARLEQQLRTGVMIAGDDHLDLQLPTDLFDGAHFLYTRGLSLKQRIAGVDALVFVGANLATFSNPLFPGGKASAVLGFLSLHKEATPKWQIFSETVLTSKQTQILAVQWKPSSLLQAAVSGGIGSNSPYGAASLDLKRSWIDFKSSYIQAGTGFHRFALNNPAYAEPIKGNLAVTINPSRFFSLDGGIQNYLVPLAATGKAVSSTSAEAGLDLHFSKADLAGTLYQSTYLGQTDHAGSAGLRWSITRRLRFISTLLASHPQQLKGNSSVMTTLEETVSQRVTINQSVSLSNGAPTSYFGGSVQSNFVSLSANYETFYVPTRTADPFETALIVDLDFRFLGRYRLHGQTNLSPTGRLLYAADAYGMTFRGDASHQANESIPLGKSILRVQALDGGGRPVEGAALLIDQRLAYTDSMGQMFIRERRPETHHLTVALSQFLNYGGYEVVSAPETVSSSADENAPAALVILRRDSARPALMDPSLPENK